MDTISFLPGLLIGVGFAYLIFCLRNKLKSVSKTDFDILREEFANQATQLSVMQEKFLKVTDDLNRANEKLGLKENEYTALLTRSAGHEITIDSFRERISEQLKTIAIQEEIAKSHQNEINILRENIAEYKANLGSATENLNTQKETNSRQAEQISNLTLEINKLTSTVSKLTADNYALTDKLAVQKTEIEEFRRNSQIEFENIANRVLKAKTSEFTETNKVNLEAILRPLGEDISKFKTKVEEVYEKESKQRFSLEEKVKELVEQTNKVSSEANNLATALKGQARKQGNWGEVILESILQKSGLVRDREYFVQKTFKDDEGKILRPDVLINLPDTRTIIIDSKVSLVAYDRFSSAETAEEQNIFLLEHLRSIREHIDNLHGKKYDNLETALDFTMMFVPIEPAYLTAIQTDQDLWSYAYSKRILLISPTNLIAALKLVTDLWKREMQTKNAMEIVKRGELLYEKFVGFIESMEDVGKHITRTQNAYDNAIGQLKNGNGNLIGQAIKLKGLGLKSSKEIPPTLVPVDFETEEISEPKILKKSNCTDHSIRNILE